MSTRTHTSIVRGNRFYPPIPSDLDVPVKAVTRIFDSVYFYFRRRGNDPVTNGEKTSEFFNSFASVSGNNSLKGSSLVRDAKVFRREGRAGRVFQAAARLRGLIRKRADKGKGVACRLRGKIFRFFHLFTGPASL